MTETTGMFDNFIHPCLTCGTTVHVVSGQTQPHECHDLPAAEQPAYAWWQGYDAAKAHNTVAKKAKADAREYASLYDPPRQNTPVSTPNGLSAGMEGQGATQETPDATEAAQERVERYAEAVARAWDATDLSRGQCVDHISRAVIVLAEQEHAEKDATIAELRAEVEEYRAKKFAPMSRIHRAERVAENAVADKRAAEARVAELEATVARVRALADELERNDCTCECCRDDETPFSLRAALAGSGGDRG